MHTYNQVIALLLCTPEQIEMSNMEQIECSRKIPDFYFFGVVQSSRIFLILIAVQTIFMRIIMISFKDCMKCVLVIRDKANTPGKKMFYNAICKSFCFCQIIFPAIESTTLERRRRHIKDTVF